MQGSLATTEASKAARGSTSGKQPSPKKVPAFEQEGAFIGGFDKDLFFWVWRVLGPYRKQLGLFVVTLLLTTVFALLRPLAMRSLLDEGVIKHHASSLTHYGLALLGLVLAEQFFGFIQIYVIQLVGARVSSDLRTRLYRHLQTRSARFFDNQLVGRLVTRVTNDVDALGELFSSGSLNAIGDLIRVIGIVCLMWILNIKLTLIAAIAFPLVALLVWWVRGALRQCFREIRQYTSKMNGEAYEQVNGIAVIQAFCAEERKAVEFAASNIAYRDANLKSIKYEAIQDAAIEMVAALCLACIVMALGIVDASFGTVVAFNAFITQLFEPLSLLAQRYTLLQSAMTGAERIVSLLNVNEEDAPSTSEVASPPLSTSPRPVVQMHNLTFAYNQDRPVLEAININIAHGEKVALVGPTGSGKTTLSALMMRFYDVAPGMLMMFGNDINVQDVQALRRRIAWVPQEMALFPTTLCENIALDASADMNKVQSILENIGALDLPAFKNCALDVPLLEQGVNFSQGERQLIAMARAMYRDSELVILDEATSSLDSLTEARMQRATDELLKGRSALIIAHRLSTLRAVDRIIVLQRGHVIESGSYTELLKQGGLFAKLHALQTHN